MTYGIQIWGAAKKSNINILQSFQSISLRVITGAPWFVSNQSLHNDLKILTLPELASQSFKKLHTAIINHQNPLISNLHSLTNPINPLRRLKRRWPRDLLI
uniref:Putative RNA-directed DNA polymerase n=1 Tax=Sipha flava TaxID=143950 RepID=A0A2S2QYV7_9HEMI